MKKPEIIEILVITLNEFYREDHGNKILLWREKMDKLKEDYPDVNWMQSFTANIDVIKAGEKKLVKKLSLNKKLKKLNKIDMVRILFDEKDFETLVSGGIVKKDGVEIALQDIEYLVMSNILDKLYNEYLNKK